MLSLLIKFGILKKTKKNNQDDISEELPSYQEVVGEGDVDIEKQKKISLQIEGKVDIKQQLKDTIEELRCIEEEGQPIGAKHLEYCDYQDKDYLEELKDTGLLNNGTCALCGRLVYQSWKKNPDGTAIYHKYCHQKYFFGNK